MQEEIGNSPWWCCHLEQHRDFRERVGENLGKSRSWAMGRVTLLLTLLSWSSRFGYLRERSASSSTDPVTERNPWVLRVGKLLQEHWVQPSTHHHLVSQSRALKPVCTHGELAAPLSFIPFPRILNQFASRLVFRRKKMMINRKGLCHKAIFKLLLLFGCSGSQHSGTCLLWWTLTLKDSDRT